MRSCLPMQCFSASGTQSVNRYRHSKVTGAHKESKHGPCPQGAHSLETNIHHSQANEISRSRTGWEHKEGHPFLGLEEEGRQELNSRRISNLSSDQQKKKALFKWRAQAVQGHGGLKGEGIFRWSRKDLVSYLTLYLTWEVMEIQ